MGARLPRGSYKCDGITMDPLINAAARSLAKGDPIGALKRVALRDDAPSLALRGIAMAQIGDFTRARTLLRNAARAFGPREAVARARCVLAEAEIALVTRDLAGSEKRVEAAQLTLEAWGDWVNAAHARYIRIRRLLLLGRLDEAEKVLGEHEASCLPPPLRTTHELALAGIAMRRLQMEGVCGALARARRAAQQAGIPGLMAEVNAVADEIEKPAARLIARGNERLLLLEDVEALLASKTLVVDACRNAIRQAGTVVPLAGRPVLFTLARELAEAWPEDVPRDTLVARAFRSKHTDESYRLRLRVEIARLRKLLGMLADIKATPRGFVMAPCGARAVAVLTHPTHEEHGTVLALLSDGEAWSSGALALALRTSQRTVQRALGALARDGKAHSFGNGRSRRWSVPMAPGFATTLLLPTTLPNE